MNNDTLILIPAYEPDALLLQVLEQLQQEGLPCLVVDDGSGPAYAEVFEKAGALAVVAGYPENRGKGGALKYGMEYIRKQMPQYRFFITADADGQHAVADILRVRELLRAKGGMVLGSRGFHGKVPLRSIMGNGLSRFNYAVAGTYYLRDNQTGLRGFETKDIPWLCSIPGTHYDYELNALMYAAKRSFPIHELEIQTIYIEGNSRSHFRSVVDTLRLHRKIFRASIPSLLALGLRILCFFLLLRWLPCSRARPDLALALSGLAGAGLSFLLNAAVYQLPAGGPLRVTWPRLGMTLLRLCLQQLLFALLFHLLGLPVVWALIPAILLTAAAEYCILKLLAQPRYRVINQTRL